MESIVTSKFQTTIPKTVRDNLKIKVNDAIEWKIENGRVIITPVQAKFLKHKNSVSTGKGNISEDIQTARKMRAERYR
ncbi:MAG: type II toxin-antitoxin system PrlF family antitoxin [Deltaproteobacteria bacterium]|nr:type II toxin-antitoxin system PrlF family antitoxin [Deltaproteobacteria bacterium]